MPLPPALAARLAKRGIVSAEEVKPKEDEEVEEVFAEDYDDEDDDEDDMKNEVDDPSSSPETTHVPDNILPDELPKEDDDVDNDQLIYERYNCPHRSNPYHTCVDYCRNRYGRKVFKHDKSCNVKRENVLNKYPLPDDWEEVGDPDTGRYYYWNTSTDQVSWLPPLHPKSNIVYSSEADLTSQIENLATETAKERSLEHDDIDLEDIEDPDTLLEREFERRDKDRSDRDRDRDKDRERDRDRDRDRDRSSSRKKGRSRARDDELDPMDPASYSDIPRGTWTTGLEMKGSAKTGVDSTASGPLFQQRPYPSPGAVLRANKEMED